MPVSLGLALALGAAGGPAFAGQPQQPDPGSVEAMIRRAAMLATGNGVAENDAEARLWYQRAAESGRPGYERALRGLGGMLVSGEGGPVDLPRGVAYLLLAREVGDENADNLLSLTASQITPEIQASAEAIARDWRQRHAPATSQD